ncbi:hypothetical protein S7711_01208 [Stachybotrys chartarum IBT 7711]|uniref:Uncharacterized protein n=1 Tax=Stachybotrys chartarum (strain CBS 109288 / IBT 7711) TaxID=1280523 RepID=A0A084AT04_STACB|nr:hypothetical protein S7711_01208 [Stachybotrys chartarum IBT 7711]
MAVFSCLTAPFRRRPSQHQRSTDGGISSSSSPRVRHRRRKAVSKPRLNVAMSQSADEWSQATRNLLSAAVTRPLPPTPAGAPLQTHAQLALAQTGDSAYTGAYVLKAASEPLSPAAVRSVVECIGVLFEGMAYAVCGLAAMTYYGFRGRRPTQVSLLCPSESRRVMQCWAVAKGMRPVPDALDAFWLNTPDGGVRRVRLKFTSEFRGLSSVRVGPSRTSILTLPSVADMVALGYVHGLQDASLRRQQAFANDMCWILRLIAEMRDEGAATHRLRGPLVPHIVQRTFWLPFTLSFPDSVALFARAGLAMDVDGLGLRQPAGAGRVDHAQLQRSAARVVRFDDEVGREEDAEWGKTPRATMANSSARRYSRPTTEGTLRHQGRAVPSTPPRRNFEPGDRPYTDPGSPDYGGFV